VPIEVAFAILLATGSYLIVERPFLALKDRLSLAAARQPTSPQSGFIAEQVSAEGRVPFISVSET
jgi:peptidoglycan/LPS O-acetylase OafA/YrhL